MYNNPLKASDAVESESWDKYVAEGKRSHKHKKEDKDKDKDKGKSPFAMAGMSFKTDQTPMKKLTVASPYKSMSMIDLVSTGVESTAEGNMEMEKLQAFNKDIPVNKQQSSSPAKLADPVSAALVTGLFSLGATGIGAWAQAEQDRKDRMERRLNESRRQLERGQDTVMQAMTNISDSYQRRAASAGSWYQK